jgi:hypothetical protein
MGLFSSDMTQNFTPALGKPTGFFENLIQGYRQQFVVDSPYSLESEVENAWKSTLLEYEKITGKKPNFRRDMAALNSYARVIQGEDVSFWQRDISGEITPDLQQSITAFKAFNEEIKAMNDPRLKSFETVLEEVFELQKSVEKQTALMGETGGISGAIGQFIGATAGTLTIRDPLALATLGVGGIGRSIATRIATSAAASGAITAATEFGSVIPNRELAGLPERDPLFDVAVSAAAGGVFEGIGVVAARLLRDRQLRAQAAEKIDRAATRDQLRESLDEIDDPRARGAAHIMDMEEVVIKASPYGTTREGLRRFTAELEEIRSLFAGETAIARVLPPIPADELEKLADFDIVRAKEPEVFARLDRARDKLARAQARLDDIEANMPTFEDAIESIDPDTGAIVRGYLKELEKPGLTTAKRREIEKQLDIITQSISVEAIEARMNDLQIMPRKMLKTQRNSLRSANKEYKKAMAEVEAARERFRIEQAAVEKLETLKVANSLVDAVASGRTPVQMMRLNGGAAEAVARRFEELPEDLISEADALLSRFSDDAKTIDLGEEISLDMTIFDDSGNSITVRELLEDLKEDQRLDAAMRSCVL